MGILGPTGGRRHGTGLLFPPAVPTFRPWLTILGAGAVTFAVRLSFIALLGRMRIPPPTGRALRFVPAAVLTAVVIPLLFYENGALEVSLATNGWSPVWWHP